MIMYEDISIKSFVIFVYTDLKRICFDKHICYKFNVKYGWCYQYYFKTLPFNITKQPYCYVVGDGLDLMLIEIVAFVILDSHVYLMPYN